MKLKKLLIVLVPVIVLIALYFYLRPAAALQFILPDVKKINLLDVRFNNDSVLADLNLQLKNRGVVKLNIQEFNCRLMLDTMPFMNITRKAQLKLSPRKSASFRLPLHFSFSSLRQLIDSKNKTDSLLITADVDVSYDTWFGHTTLSRIEQFYVAVPQPPDIEIKGTKLKGIRNGAILVDAFLQVKNPGKLSLKLKEVRYNVQIEDVAVADETGKQDIQLLAENDSIYILPMKMKLKKPLGAVLAKVSGKKFRYTADIRAILLNDSVPGREVPVHLVKSGFMSR